MAQGVPNLCVSRKVFLKYQVNWLQYVGQYRICLGVTFGLLTILLMFWTSICPCWLDVMYRPRSSVCVTSINLGLTTKASLTSNIFDGPMTSLGLIRKNLTRCQVRAYEMKSKAKCLFSVRNRDVQFPHKRWSTLKSAVFSLSSSLPPIVGGGVNWLASRLIRPICCQVIWTASSPGSMLICQLLAIRLLILSPLLSCLVRLGVSC